MMASWRGLSVLPLPCVLSRNGENEDEGLDGYKVEAGLSMTRAARSGTFELHKVPPFLVP